MPAPISVMQRRRPRESHKQAERQAEQAQHKAEADQRRLDNIWSQAVDRAQGHTRALERQATTYRIGAGEVARYLTEQELLNASWEAGKADSPNLCAQICGRSNPELRPSVRRDISPRAGHAAFRQKPQHARHCDQPRRQ